MLAAIAAIPLCIWLYLLLGRGDFWRVADKFAPHKSSVVPMKRIVAVIPARNEVTAIAESLLSLFAQGISIILVDDNSSDRTAEVARQCGLHSGYSDQLTVIQGKPLPVGWTGKLWAVHQGVECAAAYKPDYLLLTDADIVHGPTSVAELVAVAETGAYELVSYMVKLSCISLAEKALVPAFVFFFFMLYPPKSIASPRSKVAGAAGGCMLVRPEALVNAGGIGAIRNTMIDDCALAGIIKQSGGRVWLGLTTSTRSNRSYGSFAEIGRMISRTAFHQLKHSPLLLLGTILGLFVTYVLPLMLIVSGSSIAAAEGALGWVVMSVAYLPMVRFYGRSWLWAGALPLIACFYLCATIHSAVQYWRGHGGEWKGRAQDLRG